MFGNNKETPMLKSGGSQYTLLSSSCTINGDLVTKDEIQIQGTVNGNVLAESKVIISETGMVKGDVKCKDLVVLGTIEGKITTTSLQLKPSSRINGEINTQTLEVESGAVYQGAVNMGKTSTPASPTIKKELGKINL